MSKKSRIRPHELNIIVLGTINLDTLVLPDGKVQQSFGGILYNILSLANFLPLEDTITPVCRIGEEHYGTILTLCKSFPHIRWDQIQKDPAGTNENLITYTSSKIRTERLTRRVSPISLSDIKPFLNAEVVLINFISGLDISLEALKYLKIHKTGLLCVDVQSLGLDLGEDGTKFLRPIPHWRDWLGHLDIVKLNENEIKTLSDDENLLEEPYVRTALKLIRLGISMVLITLGPEGSQLVYRDLDTGIYLYVSQGVPVNNVMDPTGCGDVFLSAFLAYYLKERSVLQANLLAHAAAALNCQKAGLAGVPNLGKARELMQRTYRNELSRIQQGYKGEKLDKQK